MGSGQRKPERFLVAGGYWRWLERVRVWIRSKWRCKENSHPIIMTRTTNCSVNGQCSSKTVQWTYTVDTLFTVKFTETWIFLNFAKLFESVSATVDRPWPAMFSMCETEWIESEVVSRLINEAIRTFWIVGSVMFALWSSQFGVRTKGTSPAGYPAYGLVGCEQRGKAPNFSKDLPELPVEWSASECAIKRNVFAKKLSLNAIECN